MRRRFFQTCSVLGLSLAARPVLAKPGHAPDARLLGRWRSDRELTVKGWCFERPIDDATRARFEGLFGKLMLTFSHSHVTSLSEGVTTSRPY